VVALDAEVKRTRTIYELNGRTLGEVSSLGNRTTTVYDALNRRDDVSTKYLV
jgi:hypothetical protein